MAGLLMVLSLAIGQRPYSPERADPVLEKWRWNSYPMLNGLGIKCMVEDAEGTLWFGGSGRIIAYKALFFQEYNSQHGLPKDILVNNIDCDENGNIYACLLDRGIYRLENERWVKIFPEGEAPVNISAMNVVSSEIIWTSTEKGIVRIENGKAYYYNNFGNNYGKNKDEVFASWQSQWDEGYLYLRISVNDSLRFRDSKFNHNDDCVEVHIDAHNLKSEKVVEGVYVYQFRVEDDRLVERNFNNTAGVEFDFEYYPDNYVLNVKIPWKNIGIPAREGSRIGFDLMLQNDDDGGEREFKLAWYSEEAMAFQNPSLYGELALNRENRKRAGLDWSKAEKRSIDKVVYVPYAVTMDQDQEGNIWLGNRDGKISKILPIDQKTGYTVVHDYTKSTTLGTGWPTFHAPESGGLLIATHDPNYGFIQFDGRRWMSKMLSESFGGDDAYHSILELSNKSIVLGGYNQFYVFDKGRWTLYQNPEVPISVDVPIEFLYETRDKKLWVIERGSRVWRFDPSDHRWLTYNNLNIQLEEENGKQWFISSAGEVVCNNEGGWESFDSRDGLLDKPTRIIKSQKGQILVVGSMGNRAAVSIYQNDEWLTKIFDSYSWGINGDAIAETADGKIWFGTVLDSKNTNQTGGILCYANSDNQFLNDDNWSNITFPDLPAVFVYCLVATPDTSILGGMSVLYEYKNNVSTTIDLGSSNIYNTLDTHQSTVWVGTQYNGLYQKTDSSWTNYTMHDGLPSNTIMHLSSLGADDMIILTDNGFSRFDGHSFFNDIFPEEIAALFDIGGIVVGNNKSIWLNSTPRGWKLRALNPSAEDEKESPKNSLLTMRYLPDTLPPRTTITSAPGEITLPNEVLINWTASDPWVETRDQDLQYSFRINQASWSPFVSENYHVLQGLKAGQYTFEVRARDKDFNIESTPASTSFRVLAPLYKRWWFILSILLVSSIIILLVLKLIQNRIKHTLAIEKVKSDKLRSIDLARVKFFTNISHELRTPLTLILSYTEKISESLHLLPEKSRKQFELLNQNTRRLHRIINQVLDLRKLQAGDLKLDPVFDDIILFTAKCVEAFKSEATEKDILLNYLPSRKQFFTHFDNIKLEHILYNLISNALKFTQEGSVSVHLVIGAERMKFEIRDTGIGIEPELTEKIFDRFYQVDDSSRRRFEGTGVGLSLVEEMVRLYKGEIALKSKPGEGTSFTISIPILREMDLARSEEVPEIPLETLPEPKEENDDGGSYEEITDEVDEQNRKDAPVLLVVEDNQEIREFLLEELKENYTIHAAEDGVIGKEKAFELIPDLIISDIMMPNMNGKELCGILKNDPKTNHIPIIMLTVLDSENSQIESLDLGADDHISKPFSIKLLKHRIDNLLESRNQLREKISKQIWLKPTEIEASSSDDELLKKCYDIINDNLSDPDFSTAMLADKLNITQKQLYRKLTSLLNFTANQYIRILRLNRAADLLVKSDMTISQITFEVGFQNLRYFRKIFKEQFGKTPSEYAAENSETRPI